MDEENNHAACFFKKKKKKMSDSVIAQNYSNKYCVLSMYAKSENAKPSLRMVCLHIR